MPGKRGDFRSCRTTMASPSVKQSEAQPSCNATRNRLGHPSNTGTMCCRPRARMQTAKLQTALLQPPMAAGPDERRARGTSFVYRGRRCGRRLELNEHSPRTSNLVSSTQAGGGYGVRQRLLRGGLDVQRDRLRRPTVGSPRPCSA
jgi:hypothetical protein